MGARTAPGRRWHLAARRGPGRVVGPGALEGREEDAPEDEAPGLGRERVAVALQDRPQRRERAVPAAAAAVEAHLGWRCARTAVAASEELTEWPDVGGSGGGGTGGGSGGLGAIAETGETPKPGIRQFV